MHKSSPTGSLSASTEGKGGEKGNRKGPGAAAPARAAFKLRFHHLSQEPRLMEPARGAGPIAAALPPAAGQWRRAFLGRGRSRLLSLAVVCGLGLVRAPLWAALCPQFCSGGFCVRLLLRFPRASFVFVFVCPARGSPAEAVRLGGGSAPPPSGKEQAHRRERGCDGCGEGDSPPRCRSSWKTPRS